MFKAVLLAGVAVGYVLGTRSGRSRLDRIATSARSLRDQPTVQETAGVLQGQAVGLASAARQTVSSRVNGRVAARRRPPRPTGAVPGQLVPGPVVPGPMTPGPVAPAAVVPGPIVQPYGEPSPGTPAAGGFGTETSTGPDLTVSTDPLPLPGDGIDPNRTGRPGT